MTEKPSFRAENFQVLVFRLSNEGIFSTLSVSLSFLVYILEKKSSSIYYPPLFFLHWREADLVLQLKIVKHAIMEDLICLLGIYSASKNW